MEMAWMMGSHQNKWVRDPVARDLATVGEPRSAFPGRAPQGLSAVDLEKYLRGISYRAPLLLTWKESQGLSLEK